MLVEIGNDNAIEGYRQGEDETVLYRPLPGERVTTIVIPPGIGIQEAFASVVGALSSHHMESGAKPAWIETDTPGLTALLCEHYGLDPAKNVRPALWGQPKTAKKKTTTRRTKAAQKTEEESVED